MTGQRHKTPNPKDEFIITREQMKWIREGSQMDVIDTLEDVFTRPAASQPPAAPLQVSDPWKNCKEILGCNESWCEWPCDNWVVHFTATIRNEVLDAILTCAETDGEWFRIDGTDFLYLNYQILSKKCESLRTPGTADKGGD